MYSPAPPHTHSRSLGGTPPQQRSIGILVRPLQAEINQCLRHVDDEAPFCRHSKGLGGGQRVQEVSAVPPTKTPPLRLVLKARPHCIGGLEPPMATVPQYCTATAPLCPVLGKECMKKVYTDFSSSPQIFFVPLSPPPPPPPPQTHTKKEQWQICLGAFSQLG